MSDITNKCKIKWKYAFDVARCYGDDGNKYSQVKVKYGTLLIFSTQFSSVFSFLWLTNKNSVADLRAMSPSALASIPKGPNYFFISWQPFP